MKSPKLTQEVSNVTLDAGVWGKLPDAIALRKVYEKLPQQDLMRLRLVCKEWNHAALQRLKPKPYFVTIQIGQDDEFLNGILSYDVVSGKFNYEPEQIFPLCHTIREAPLEVEGLIFCYHPDQEMFEGQRGVFNVHTKTWHSIPPAPAPVSTKSRPKHRRYSKSAYGMVVDTSERPYSFILVVGSCENKTQTYDSKSRSWKTLSSQLMPLAGPALDDCAYLTCICSNGCLYISLGVKLLLVYSLEADNWTALDFPQVDENAKGSPDFISTHALGVWEGRIFSSREKPAASKVTVWELVNQEWVEYAGTPQEVEEEEEEEEEYYDLLMGPSTFYRHVSYANMMVPCFSDGYLLVYKWQYDRCRVESLMMLSLATKEWKDVDLPMGTMAITARHEGSDYAEEECEDEDEVEDGADDDEDGEDDEDLEDGEDGEDGEDDEDLEDGEDDEDLEDGEGDEDLEDGEDGEDDEKFNI